MTAERGLWLVRHGALPPNPERRFVGARDLPLSKAGRAQIRALAVDLAPVLADPRLVALLSSDLSRCRETAAILAAAAGRPLLVHADADLREISLGDWEGLTPAEVERAFPGQYASRGRDFAHFSPPGGESFVRVQQRSLAALERWRARYPEGLLLLAGHAGLNRCLLARYLALPLARCV